MMDGNAFFEESRGFVAAGIQPLDEPAHRRTLVVIRGELVSSSLHAKLGRARFFADGQRRASGMLNLSALRHASLLVFQTSHEQEPKDQQHRDDRRAGVVRADGGFHAAPADVESGT